MVCRLKRSIYGLKQSTRCWNSALDVQLKAMGFAQSTSDPCIYTSTKGEVFIIAVYVDDILLAGKTDERIAEVKKALSERLVTATEDCETINQGLYQSAVGSLLYLSNWTRPDITYAVSSVSRFCSRPSKQHWIVVKRKCDI